MAELSAATAKGHNGGRPSKLSPDQVRAARRLYDEREHTVQQIGSIFAVSRTSIYRALRDKPGRRLAPAGGAADEVRRRQPGEQGRRNPDGGAAGDSPGHPGGAGRGDAEDAAGLVADAAVSTALEVGSAAGVEAHLPVPGSLIVPRDGGQPGGSRRCRRTPQP